MIIKRGRAEISKVLVASENDGKIRLSVVFDKEKMEKIEKEASEEKVEEAKTDGEK